MNPLKMKEHAGDARATDMVDEQYENYVPTRLSERYDAFIHIDETNALTLL